MMSIDSPDSCGSIQSVYVPAGRAMLPIVMSADADCCRTGSHSVLHPSIQMTSGPIDDEVSQRLRALFGARFEIVREMTGGVILPHFL